MNRCKWVNLKNEIYNIKVVDSFILEKSKKYKLISKALSIIKIRKQLTTTVFKSLCAANDFFVIIFINILTSHRIVIFLITKN